MKLLNSVAGTLLFMAAGGSTLLTTSCASSRVPDPLAQGRALASQAVSAVDVSEDGRFIAIGTLSHRQNPNFWVLSEKGEILFGRTVAPWAPMQVAALGGGKAFGTGLAYSRVTSPLPTISLFSGEKDEETVLEDSLGERGWLRYGQGDWRTGWTRCLLGDFLVRAGDSLVTVRGHNGAVRLLQDGRREKHPMGYERPYRMAAGKDGSTTVFGYIVAEGSSSRPSSPLVTVSEAATGKLLWSVAPSNTPLSLPPLPEPALDFPDLAERFRMRPDAVVPFRVAASVSSNSDGSSVAVAEYGGWQWVRRTPAIGKWDPPYHVIPFVPRQRGTLRIVTAPGAEKVRVEFPQDGLFEVRSDAKGKKIWAVPMAWFARGMAGSAWLPTDDEARTVFEFDVDLKRWKTSWTFSDAVGDVAFHPDGTRAWVSCWDGRLHLVHQDGRDPVVVDAGAVARVAWSRDGSFAIAGTENGEVLCLDSSPRPRWRVRLPSSEPSPENPLKPVQEGVPIYSVGRTGKEHAYVGDTWLIQTPEGGLLVDAGGSSSVSHSLKKIEAAGVDVKKVRHLLHTHSHGDHCGAAYLWRSMGLQIVAPESAAFAMSWVMPMLTDYGVWVPRPVDVPLPLRRPGDEAEFTLSGLKIRAIFVPGHSMDSVVYLMELGGKRVAFTGDIGFQQPSDILHRCWGDGEKAKIVIDVVRTKVLSYRPDVVFTGHGIRVEGTAFLEDLVRRSEESLQKAGAQK